MRDIPFKGWGGGDHCWTTDTFSRDFVLSQIKKYVKLHENIYMRNNLSFC